MALQTPEQITELLSLRARSLRPCARAVKREVGKMNNLEKKYADALEIKKRAGIILEFWFEAMKFRMADKTYYTPDFMVLLPNYEMELHEVKATWGNGKAHWEDDARVKIKVVAEIFPFRFKGVTMQKGQWVYEDF